MEVSKVDHFLRPLFIFANGDGYGYGDGYGDGDGDANGNGDGYGYGNGYGNGYGYGYGDGYGDGDGLGIKSLNSQFVYKIDNIQTIITSVKNDVAKGFIINSDLTQSPCYIVRNDYCFSHGVTLKKALTSLEDKTTLTLPIEKRIEAFKTTFKDFHKKIKAAILYDWHYRLTGSCKMGRDNFILNHNIDLNKDKFTVFEFIKLTENAYNGHIIKQL